VCVRVRELAHMRVYAKKIKYKSKEKWDHVIGFTGVEKKRKKKKSGTMSLALLEGLHLGTLG